MPNHKQQQQQHRESITNDDDVGHAPESGEPTEMGHSHGKPIDEKGKQADPRKTKGDHLESGRHRAS